MRFWILNLSVILFLGGCSAPKIPNIIPQIVKPKQEQNKEQQSEQKKEDAKSIGNGITYMSEEVMLDFMKTSFTAQKPNEQLLQSVLLQIAVASKDGTEIKLNPLGQMRLEGEISKVNSFAFNKERDEYLVSGSWYKDTNYAGGNTVTRNFSFIVVYDGQTKNFKGFYYNVNSSKYNYITISPDGNKAFLKYFSNGVLLDIKDQKTLIIKEPTNTFINSLRDESFSQDGNLLLLVAQKDNNTKILIFDTNTGQMILQDEEKNTQWPRYSFAKDGSRVFIAYEEVPYIKNIDIKTRTTTTISKPFDATTYIHAFDSFALFGTITKDFKSEQLVYDTKNNSLICKAQKGNFILRPFDAKIDKEKNTLSVWEFDQKIFVIDGGECTLANSKRLEIDTKGAGIQGGYVINNNELVTIGSKGGINTANIDTLSMTEDEIEMVKSTATAAKLLDAGFEKRGLDILEQIVKNPNYDVFGSSNYLTFVKKFQTPYQVYIQILAFERYKSEGKDFATHKDFQRALRNFIFYASHTGFRQLIPDAIKTYESIIGATPNKDQEDMLAIFKAMYLLDINKDDEGYDLLFDQAPLGKDAIYFIKNYSAWKTGLMKDVKKLSIATGISESDLSENPFKATPEFLFDLEKNRVKKGEMPKDGGLQTVQQPSPKQEAIRLLD